MKTAYIFLNGELPGNESYYIQTVKGCNAVFCADGGANHAFRLGRLPSLIIGDFDSISKEAERYFSKEHVRFERYPEQKDSSDTEILIDKAVNDGYNDIVIFGGFGGRIDHLMGNILLLEKYSDLGVSISITSPKTEIRVIFSIHKILQENSIPLSIFSLTDCSEISLEGFAYPLKEKTIRRSSTLGLSNIINSDEAQITVHKGKVLMIKGEE